ncbi:MAG: response regulator transcription factor [Desulfobacteraceae bacterium]|nr:response regulator transcription factor [Desulfobacteraceae bacterium]
MTFAAMLSKQQAQPSKCPYVGLPINEQVTYPVHGNDGKVVSSVTLDVDTSNKEEISQTENLKSFENETLKEANASLPFSLTKRELEVLTLMAKGQTNREISERLYISPHTVKSHVIHIFNKLGVNHRTQAVVWAVRHELI